MPRIDLGEGHPPAPSNLRNLTKRPPLTETPAVDGDRFLFLGGLHKSGTSILHRLLRAHSETSGFSDTGFPQDEGQLIQSVYPPAWAHGGPGRFAFDPKSRITEGSKLVSESSRSQILREWGAYFDLDRRLLLEKSPPNIIRSRFLQALFPRARFVFIVRHPVPVAYATLKWAKTSIADLILHWCVAHRILLEDVDKLERAMIVRYEDFVAEPVPCMSKIYQFADLHDFPLTEAVSDQGGKYFARWQSERMDVMGELQNSIQTELGTMSQFGYSLSEPYVGSPWGTDAAPQ
jgi:hypothetical protein